MRDISNEALKDAVNNLKWNFEDGYIEATDETSDRPFNIDSLDELIEYLENEIVQALNAEMPTEWLKRQSDFNYDTEVKEFLNENFSKEIDKLAWNSNDL